MKTRIKKDKQFKRSRKTRNRKSSIRNKSKIIGGSQSSYDVFIDRNKTGHKDKLAVMIRDYLLEKGFIRIEENQTNSKLNIIKRKLQEITNPAILQRYYNIIKTNDDTTELKELAEIPEGARNLRVNF
jgi:hypothetical protein